MDSADERTPILPQSHAATAPEPAARTLLKSAPVHAASITIVSLSLAFIAGTVAYLQLKDGFSLFALHPIFMTLAVLLGGSAIAAAQVHRSLVTKPLFTVGSVAVKVPQGTHTVLAAAAVASAIAGLVIMVVVKNEGGEAHFESTHAILGLSTIVAAGLQAVFGATAKYAPRAFGGALAARKALRRYHRTFGYAVLGGFATTLLYGIDYLGLADDKPKLDAALRVAVVGAVLVTVARALV
ncbi:hypothetical protein H9P43_007538 [Blastocladiella emersonii ATCC 22665]|nr:hypothetical protein H9P43_007538 [Blastocladiella emersonii ATCC 22665]